VEKIKDAIFIYGPGRSGTTLLYNILALYPGLSWISGYVNRFPNLHHLSFLNKIQHFHKVEKFSRNLKKWPRPSECYNFWYYYFPSFSMPKTHKEKNLNDNLVSCVNSINGILKQHGGKRFITKLTGDHDLTKLEQIFVEPKIIYINRDPRAVVMSYFRRKWTFHGKVGPLGESNLKDLLRQYAQQYIYIYYASAKILPKLNSITVKYEDLIRAPEKFFHNLLEFVDLEFSAKFKRTLLSWELEKKTNLKWKSELSVENCQYLEALLSDICCELGYK